MIATAAHAPLAARPVTPLGILAAQLEKIVTLAQAEGVSPELMAALRGADRLASGLDPYIESVSTPESDALAKLAAKTRAENWRQRFGDGETAIALEQEMLSGHLEGQTLKMFVSAFKARRVLEIGMFTGYATLAMAEALPEDGLAVACEIDAYVAEFARDCFAASAHGSKIQIEVAPAMKTLQNLADAGECFDLAFIDADKASYIDYFNLLLDRNLIPVGGIICADNTLYQGQAYLSEDEQTANGAAIARFNAVVAADDRVEQVLLPLRDGLTLARRVA